MNIDTDTFITGEPIETAIGDCRFFTVREYKKVAQDLSMMSLSKDHIINLLSRDKPNPELKVFIKQMVNYSLYDIVQQMPDFKDSYDRIFKAAFPDGGYEKINAGTFPKIRELILKMNCVTEEKVNPNPEIQAALERSKRVKALEGGDLKFSDLISSVAMYSGIPYREINNFTILQLYMSFHRISHLKSYDTTTLFATVPGSKVKIENWSKHINLHEEENHSVAYDKFKKTTGNMFND